MANPPDADRNGVRLRSGLPESNGLAGLASELIKNKTKITYMVAAVRVAAINLVVENDSRTASMKIISLEADLTEDEIDQVQRILDRARSRRTGEEPLFSNDGVEAPTPITRAPRARR